MSHDDAMRPEPFARKGIAIHHPGLMTTLYSMYIQTATKQTAETTAAKRRTTTHADRCSSSLPNCAVMYADVLMQKEKKKTTGTGVWSGGKRILIEEFSCG